MAGAGRMPPGGRAGPRFGVGSGSRRAGEVRIIPSILRINPAPPSGGARHHPRGLDSQPAGPASVAPDPAAWRAMARSHPAQRRPRYRRPRHRAPLPALSRLGGRDHRDPGSLPRRDPNPHPGARRRGRASRPDPSRNGCAGRSRGSKTHCCLSECVLELADQCGPESGSAVFIETNRIQMLRRCAGQKAVPHGQAGPAARAAPVLSVSKAASACAREDARSTSGRG